MTESPYNLMKSGRINDAAPWMLGVVENVCLLDTWSKFKHSHHIWHYIDKIYGYYETINKRMMNKKYIMVYLVLIIVEHALI